MEKVYIKGVPGRGAEVIAKLESLGGLNEYRYGGEKDAYYFINVKGEIDYTESLETQSLIKWVGTELFLDEPADNKPNSTEQNNVNKPVWDEERQGVFIPTIEKVLDLHNLSNKKETWTDAMRLAKEAGKTIFTKEEGYINMYFKDEINKILLEHGGDKLDGWYWTSSEFDSNYVWGTNFTYGVFDYNYKCIRGYVRAISSK